MRRFSNDVNRIGAVLTCAFVALAGCSEQPTRPDEAGDGSVPLLKRGGKGGGQATYEYTFTGDIQSPIDGEFLATASSKDPFGVDTEGVTLHFPTGELAQGCDPTRDPPLETDWGLHKGVDYTGHLKFSGPKGKKVQLVSLLGDADPDRFMNLAVQLREETVVDKIIGNPTSTLTFTNATALVGMGSHPPGKGPR